MIIYKRITPEDLMEAINMPQNGDTTRFLLYTHRLWELENAFAKGEIVAFPRKYCDRSHEAIRVEWVDGNGEIMHRFFSTEKDADDFIERELNKDSKRTDTL